MINSEHLYHALTGTTGIGKSALALKVAYHQAIKEHFCDGVIWFGLPEISLSFEYGKLANEVDSSKTLAIYNSEREKEQALKNIIGDKRVLIILDHANDIEKAKALRVGGRNSRYLLTTQKSTLAYDFAGEKHTYEINTLSWSDSFKFLHYFIKDTPLYDKHTERLKEIVTSFGMSPLAVEVTGAYFRTEYNHAWKDSNNRKDEDFIPEVDPKRRFQLARENLGYFQKKRINLFKVEFSRTEKASLADVILMCAKDLSVASQKAFVSLGAFAPDPASFSEEAALKVCQCTLTELDEFCDRHLLIRFVAEGEVRYRLVTSIATIAKEKINISAQNNHWSYYLGLSETAYLNRSSENITRVLKDAHDTVADDAQEKFETNEKGWKITLKELDQIRWGWKNAKSAEQLYDRVYPFFNFLIRQGETLLLAT